MYVVVATLVFPLIAALVIYWLGGRVAAKGKQTVDKVLAYACGERLPALKLQVNLEHFYIYAVYFMVFDVLAFILATSMGVLGWLPLIYILVVVAAITPLIRKGG